MDDTCSTREDMRNVRKILVGKADWKNPLGGVGMGG
jgi:hypothetical protein